MSKDPQAPEPPTTLGDTASTASKTTSIHSSIVTKDQSNNRTVQSALCGASPSMTAAKEETAPKSDKNTASKSKSSMYSATLSESSTGIPSIIEEENEHQLQRWVYETSNSVMPFSEKTQKLNPENQGQH